MEAAKNTNTAVVEMPEERRKIKVEKRIKLERLLKDMCINPEDVLVLKDKKPLTEDVWLKKGEEIEIYEVVSRG